MPIISFSVFKDKIQNGTKKQTIRKLRKYPIKVNDRLYLWWKSRTPQREKLGEPLCIEEFIISLQFEKDWLHSGVPIWRVDRHYTTNKTLTMMDFQVEELAQRDGFGNALEMFQWFAKNHGELDGNNKFQVIRWNPLSIVGSEVSGERGTGAGDGSNPEKCSNLPIERQRTSPKTICSKLSEGEQ